jgi:cation:H+ antiporter
VFDSLPLVVNAAILACSASVVWFAGSRLAGYADTIATRTGIGQAAIGVLLLGSITSLPELAVGVTATLSGHPALSVNDVLGSAGINVLLLALADAALGRGALTSTPASPGVLLQGALSVLLLVLVAGAVVAGDRLVLGMGIGSWLMVIAYAFAVRMIVLAKGLRSWTPTQRPRNAEPPAEEGPYAQISRAQLIGRTAIAGSAIMIAGFLLAQTGAAVANQTGLGTNFVGAVLLACVTSLPEVGTVLAAVRLKRYEMAIADVFGTNLFNVMIIVVVDQLHPGKPVLVEVGAFAAFAALLASVLTLLFLVGMIERRDKTILRMGIDSLAAIVCYAAGLFVLFHLR